MAESRDHPANADVGDSPISVVELCVNLDDATGELIGAAFQALLDAGALDVWTTAITMKKQRPGTMLSLLCREPDADRLAKLVLHHTGSFGVRRRAWDRVVLQRRFVEVDTTLGPVRVKVGQLDGHAIVARPEHDDVARLAAQHQVTVREAGAAAEVAAQHWLAQQRRGGDA